MNLRNVPAQVQKSQFWLYHRRWTDVSSCSAGPRDTIMSMKSDNLRYIDASA